MRDNTRTALNIALTHLKVQHQEIETAIAAILAVLGEADMVPVERGTTGTSPAKTRPATRRQARQVAPARRSGQRRRSASTASASPVAAGVDWQQKALAALRMGEGDVQVRELATRLRIAGADRDKAIQRLWAALQTLVKDGRVVKHGPRYRLSLAASTEAA